MPHFIVIGSGPSGVACAAGLLQSGAAVTMVDIGVEMAGERRQRIAAIAGLPPSAWTRADRDWIAGPLLRAADAVPRKGLFGDLFMYDDTGVLASTPDDFALRPSQSVGGLSRVWGATLGRFDADDLSGWPVSPADLAPHFDAVEELIAGSAGLRNAGGRETLPLSPQAARLLGRWRRHADALAGAHASVTPARLAVSRDCRLCGMCLHGCPYGYIFTSADWVRAGRPGWTYRSGLRALRLEEEAGGGRAICRRSDGGIEVIAGDRIFVAAGMLGTPLLILASLDGRRAPAMLRDSQWFLLPFLARDAHPPSAPYHALSQLFLRLDDPTRASARIHAQIYTYNDVYAARIAARLGFAGRIPAARRVADYLGRRFVVAQAYLHSRESRAATLSLVGGPERPALQVTVEPSRATSRRVRQACRRLAAVGGTAGLAALPPLVQVGEFGHGFHCGATFPMAHRPEGAESDLLGRPAGLRRVHVVDASCWPAIPAGPVTLTAMANAHRIATEAARL